MRATNVVTMPYEVDEGERFHSPPFELTRGLTLQVITSRAPLRLVTRDELVAAGAIYVGGSESASWLGVPIMASDRVLGIIGLENTQPGAFSEADERLLSTIASSMGVALENARLFDETKRLLAETDERAAELAIINEVQPRARRRDHRPADVRDPRREGP